MGQPKNNAHTSTDFPMKLNLYALTADSFWNGIFDWKPDEVANIFENKCKIYTKKLYIR